MIAIVKEWDADHYEWAPMRYAWQEQADAARPPACAHRCQCGLALRAMTPAALAALIAAHRETCRGV